MCRFNRQVIHQPLLFRGQIYVFGGAIHFTNCFFLKPKEFQGRDAVCQLKEIKCKMLSRSLLQRKLYIIAPPKIMRLEDNPFLSSFCFIRISFRGLCVCQRATAKTI